MNESKRIKYGVTYDRRYYEVSMVMENEIAYNNNLVIARE